MGRSYGPGVPVWFNCPKRHEPDHDERRTWPWRIVRTGRTKPRRTSKLHPRMLTTSHEYVCSCGHVGWSAHGDVLHAPLSPEWARSLPAHLQRGADEPWVWRRPLSAAEVEEIARLKLG